MLLKYVEKANPNKDLVFEVLRNDVNTIISVYQDAGTDYGLIIFICTAAFFLALLILYVIWFTIKTKLN